MRALYRVYLEGLSPLAKQKIPQILDKIKLINDTYMMPSITPLASAKRSWGSAILLAFYSLGCLSTAFRPEYSLIDKLFCLGFTTLCAYVSYISIKGVIPSTEIQRYKQDKEQYDDRVLEVTRNRKVILYANLEIKDDYRGQTLAEKIISSDEESRALPTMRLARYLASKEQAGEQEGGRAASPA